MSETLDAIDTKYMTIRCPRGGGSQYFILKDFHSMVLLALVNADYCFCWVDVGRSSVSKIWGSDINESSTNQSE